MGGTRTRVHTPVRGVVSLEDRISAAEPCTVDVDLSYHARADELWLLAALDDSPNKLVPHRLAVARDVPSSYLNVLHTPQEDRGGGSLCNQRGQARSGKGECRGYAASEAHTCAAVWCGESRRTVAQMPARRTLTKASPGPDWGLG